MQSTSASADDEHTPFMKEPFCVYKGHSADLLDVSWSKVCTVSIYPQVNSAFYPYRIPTCLPGMKGALTWVKWCFVSQYGRCHFVALRWVSC